MPKRVPITQDQIAWLEDNHEHTSYAEMAAYLGCCVDTLKRILVRQGLQEFEGAKYVLSRDFEAETWTRPCICCKDTKPRPKGWFMCVPCRTRAGYTES